MGIACLALEKTMFRRVGVVALAVVSLVSGSAGAQGVGSATGKGTIDRLLPTGASELLKFSPHYSYAYAESAAGKRFTWIVLTEKEPPAATWSAAKDPAEARRLWCEREKSAFVAVKLDADWKVDLYFLCPANGGLNTEMVSSFNGLDSVVVKFDVRDKQRLKGSLRTGTGSCPGSKGVLGYCTLTGDYAFDVSLGK
jgi:hypothetical protein